MGQLLFTDGFVVRGLNNVFPTFLFFFCLTSGKCAINRGLLVEEMLHIASYGQNS